MATNRTARIENAENMKYVPEIKKREKEKGQTFMESTADSIIVLSIVICCICHY